MDPFTLTATALVSALVLFVPGGAAALILGYRGIGLLAVAAPLSLAGIALISLTEIVVPLQWTPWTWALSALLVIAVAVLLRWWSRRRDEWRTEPRSALAASIPFVAVAVGAIAIAARLVPVLGGEDISQTFDNVYHLNAVRYILDTGLIGPTHQIIPGFYPSLWHAMTATVAMISGASIPLAVNVTSIVLAAVVWPASVVFLTRQIAGANTTAILAAGVLSAALAAFPFQMLSYGVLYPNVLSVALLPAVLGALLQVARVGDGDRAPLAVRWTVLLVLVAVLALAHPSTLMAFFAMGAWPALAGGIAWFREARRAGNRIRLVVGLVAWLAGIAVVALLLLFARPTREQAFWQPSLALPDALMQVLQNSLAWRPASIAISVLMILGIIAVLAFRRRWWWLVAGWATVTFLFIACVSFPDGLIRYGLTGTWYSDFFRIVALMPTMIVPLSAVGLALTVAGLLRVFRVNSDAVVSALGAVLAAAVLAVTQTGAQLAAASSSLAAVYELTDTSSLLTTDEAALLERVPDHVPERDTIAGSPWTGTALSYALADRAALIPHIYQQFTPDIALLADKLNQVASDPAVCEAVDRTRTRWVLDFGTAEVHSGNHVYAGLVDLENAPGVELVDQEGSDARLFRITACD